MMNSQKTKKKLTGSVIALIVCFAMLLGTTFAWFTDTASTSVNTIQSGTLDVALEMQNAEGKWETVDEDDVLDFVKAASHENEKILWEPGCTYNLPKLRVVNNGNLALKYKVQITGIKGDAKLNEVIDWTIKDGEDTYASDKEQTLTAKQSRTFTISGHMQESAGNSYQGLEIEGISITVLATQAPVESDSNGNTYDENAEYPKDLGIKWSGDTAPLTRDNDTPADVKTLADVTDNEAKTVKIDTPEMLAAFAKSVSEGNSYYGWTVTLENDLDLQNKNWTPIGNPIYGGGSITNVKSGAFEGNFDGQGHTISNLKVNGGTEVPIDTNANYQGLFGCINAKGNMVYVQNLKIHNADIYAKNGAGAFVGNVDTYQHTGQSGQSNVWNCKLSGKVTIKGGNAGGIAGATAENHWAILTSYQNIVIDADEGSYVTNVGVDGGQGNIGGVAAIAAYSSGTENITSNLDVIAKAGNVGGAFGVVSGVFKNISCSGDVIIKDVSVETTDFKSYGKVLGVWAPIYSKKYIEQDTLSFAGKFEIRLTDGTVVTTNGQESDLVGGKAW